MHIDLQVSQKVLQKISTEQLQNLEILQMPDLELDKYIYELANENPLLNVTEPVMAEVNEILDYSTFNSPLKSTFNGKSTDSLQALIQAPQSPVLFLYEQIPLHSNLPLIEQKILEYLIEHLDEKFYLAIEIHEVAQEFKVEVSYIEHILSILHKFEPLGVGARTVNEYLRIQIENDEAAPRFAKEIVQQHLDKIASLSLGFLKDFYNISVKEVQKIVSYIRSLKPYPAMNYEGKIEVHIIPEVVVEKINDEWVIHLQHPLRPKIEINNEYVELLNQSKRTKDYCNKCLKDIVLLTQGIEQRDRTLYSITRILLTVQKGFFEFGLSALVPLNLKDIAVMLNLHESTISRAISGKYIKTPHGTFAFRSLFIKGINNSDGISGTVMSIKKRLSLIIKEEDKKSPISDTQIMNILRKEGIQISRRTVAKYRIEQNIPSSSKRKYL